LEAGVPDPHPIRSSEQLGLVVELEVRPPEGAEEQPPRAARSSTAAVDPLHPAAAGHHGCPPELEAGGVRRRRNRPSSPPPQREQRSSPWPPRPRGGSAGKEGGSRRRAVGREAGDRARLRDLAAPSNSPRRGRRRGGCCRCGPPSLRLHQLDFGGGNSAAAPGGGHLDGRSRRGELAGRESREGESCRRARPVHAPCSLRPPPSSTSAAARRWGRGGRLRRRAATAAGDLRTHPPPGCSIQACSRGSSIPGARQPCRLLLLPQAAPRRLRRRSWGARLVGERKKVGTREEGDGDRMGWGK
jgi:hypothetical protein